MIAQHRLRKCKVKVKINSFAAAEGHQRGRVSHTGRGGGSEGGKVMQTDLLPNNNHSAIISFSRYSPETFQRCITMIARNLHRESDNVKITFGYLNAEGKDAKPTPFLNSQNHSPGSFVINKCKSTPPHTAAARTTHRLSLYCLYL